MGLIGKKSCVKRTRTKKWTEKLKTKNHNEIFPYICQNVYYQYIRTNNAGENVEKMELSYTSDGNVSWCNHYGEQYGGSSRVLELIYDPRISFLSISPSKRCRCAQLCPTLCNFTDCSPPGSSVHGVFQARIIEWAAIFFPWIFLTQESNPHLLCLLHWQADSLPLSHQRRPFSKQMKILINMHHYDHDCIFMIAKI